MYFVYCPQHCTKYTVCSSYSLVLDCPLHATDEHVLHSAVLELPNVNQRTTPAEKTITVGILRAFGFLRDHVV